MAFLYKGLEVNGGDLLVLTFEELNGDKSEMLWLVPMEYKRDRFWDSPAGEGDFYGLNISGWNAFPSEVRRAVEGEGFTDLAGRKPLDPAELKSGDRVLVVATPEHEVYLEDWDGDAAGAKAYAERWELRVTLSEEAYTWYDDEPASISTYSMRDIDISAGGVALAYRA